MSLTGDHWTTPQCVVDALYEFAQGPIALDPCSNPQSLVGAVREWYGPPDGVDGLVAPWIADGLIYVNPPYSQKAEWTWRCKAHWKRGQEVIALVPADTDTAWFHANCWTAPARCFWKGRLRFGGDRRNHARFPSVAVYWGERVAWFAEVFSRRGHCC